MLSFEAVYQGRSPIGDRPPWDIGQPQPGVITLAEAGQIGGEVLDAGCGTGEHALYLAARGHQVTGVDVAATAVQAARDKAAVRGLAVSFEVADAFALDGYHERFDTVVDVGLFDVCGSADQSRYVAALRRACRPGATVHLLELSAAAAELVQARFAELGVPQRLLAQLPRLTFADVRAAFADGWRVEAVGESSMLTMLPGSEEIISLPALSATVRKEIF